MIRVCKVKLGKAPKQEEKLLTILEQCRQLYNAALQQRIEAWQRQHRSVSLYEQERNLTALRKEDENYKKLPVEMVRLTVLKRINRAYIRFFKRCALGEKAGFPRFKSKERFNTLILGEYGWKIEGKKLIIKAGPTSIILHMKNSVYKEGRIAQIQLVKKANRWWAHFLIDVGPAPETKNPTNPIGIDVGIKTFATLSDGKKIEHPHFIKESQDKINEANKNLARKQKGSKNRKKERNYPLDKATGTRYVCLRGCK